MDWNEYGRSRSPSRNRLTFPEHRLIVAKFIDFFKDVDTNLTVLDVGCGDGFWLEILRDLGFSKLYGIDMCQPFLEVAADKGLNVRLGNVYDLNLESSLDIVLLCDVLEHLDDVNSALDKIRNALKVGALLYLIIPVYDSLSSRFERFLKRRSKLEKAKAHDPTHLHAFSKKEILSLLKSKNFEIVKAVHTSNRLPYVSGKVQYFTFGGMFGNWLIIVARKK